VSTVIEDFVYAGKGQIHGEVDLFRSSTLILASVLMQSMTRFGLLQLTFFIILKWQSFIVNEDAAHDVSLVVHGVFCC